MAIYSREPPSLLEAVLSEFTRSRVGSRIRVKTIREMRTVMEAAGLREAQCGECDRAQSDAVSMNAQYTRGRVLGIAPMAKLSFANKETACSQINRSK